MRSRKITNGFSDYDRSSPTTCRDFLRNVCTRGTKCKYNHEEPETEKNNKLQDSMVFCHDYQNRQDCGRQNCRFIHCKKEEEEEYKKSGYLPPHLREQAIHKGVAPDLPTLYGKKPICKDFLKGTCSRQQCKFRHVSSQQYDVELAKINQSLKAEDQQRTDRMNEMTTGLNENFAAQPANCNYSYRPYLAGYDEPFEKRRRIDPVPNFEMRTLHYSPDVDLLQHENFLLRQEMLELRKEISDLVTTNNFLLDQNAQLRMSIKAATVDGIVPVSQGEASQQPQNQAPVVSMALPTATVAPQGATITMTMAVPPSSIATAPISMSLPVAQLQTTMPGSPLVTSITMAPPQPTGTLVTSMSLGPTLDNPQPLVTSINVATPLEPAQMQAPPSLTLQTLSGPPVSTMPTLHAVSQALPPPQTVTLAPNSVQVHETRLVSYPIMSVRPRL